MYTYSVSGYEPNNHVSISSQSLRSLDLTHTALGSVECHAEAWGISKRRVQSLKRVCRKTISKDAVQVSCGLKTE